MVSDTQSGFRALSERAIACLSFSQGGFSIESEMQFLVAEHKLRVAEVPISVLYAEPAKRNPVVHGLQVLNGIMHLMCNIRPLLFFGLSGVVSFLLGSVLGVYIVSIYSQTGQLAVGYGLLTVLLCIVGIVLVFAGVLLQAMRGMLQSLQDTMLNHLPN
jgi:hypothetical protein